ncbi:Uncharacterised protein (plasmid) [Legionella adelaidensis]|uniref:Transmembrane protein n=1 Tax=Legionella adelaidensis TaxID=45056 RepID=A0A0W0R451_9GAMM|nr:hypothetical protein [Legionella adelaidensis]KTC65829.1 hypothetical protein Lade_0487 [Legionella adelaidensis]VEH85259.1 Uncharacterised protein [Legionella adelaidensis]
MEKDIVKWTALFSAAILGVGINFLFNLLALGLSFSSFIVTDQGNLSFSFLGFLSFCFVAIIAMFTTGWFAGRLTPDMGQSKTWGFFYGFLAWSLLLIITIILITNMIQYTAFHANFTASLVAIKITNNAPMLTETFADVTHGLEPAKKVLTLNAFLTFILFATGAAASCIGGYLGFKKNVVGAVRIRKRA